MRKIHILILPVIVLLLTSFTGQTPDPDGVQRVPTITPELDRSPYKIPLPPPGSLYHGVFPGRFDGAEDEISLFELDSYEQAAGKPAAWVYFSHNWFNDRAFPQVTVDWIHERGSIPYIRLMMRNSEDQHKAEKVFTLKSILEGKFDRDIRAWCRSAAALDYPILAEYGTEVNGQWFAWNGVWNGGGKRGSYGVSDEPDGPERFRDTYRYLIDVCRIEGAGNITWVFHVNNEDHPQESWNRFENYYPGDDYIDWLAMSVYGAQSPFDDEWPEFGVAFNDAYNRLVDLAPGKPIIVAEFGMTGYHPKADPADWTARAFYSLKTEVTKPGSRLVGFSWWNEAWPNNDDPVMDTNMLIQDNPILAEVFLREVADDPLILGRTTDQP